jgi:hypothetical protein
MQDYDRTHGQQFKSRFMRTSAPTHPPFAVIHSPAEIAAACPTAVTNSRCPRALMRRTQKPFSGL